MPHVDPLGYFAMMFTAACLIAMPFLMAWVVTRLTSPKAPVPRRRRAPYYKHYCERHLIFLKPDELCVVVSKEECDGCKALLGTNVLTFR